MTQSRGLSAVTAAPARHSAANITSDFFSPMRSMMMPPMSTITRLGRQQTACSRPMSALV